MIEDGNVCRIVVVGNGDEIENFFMRYVTFSVSLQVD